MTRAAAALAAVVALACAEADTPRPAAERDTAGAAAAAAVCLQGGGFTAEGAVPSAAGTGAATDAVAVGELRWEPHDGCERVVIDLHAEGGASASAPGEIAADIIRELGIVRVTLHGIARAEPDATDALFGSGLAAAAYAVRAPAAEQVFVDIHLAGAAEARVMLLREPARVVIDLRPGGAEPAALPLRGQRVVLLQPHAGDARYPLEISGYSRTFEANVVARLERNGADVAEQFTTATSWLEAWGHFTLVFNDGPAGDITLHVGEYSARDGEWDGVRVPLRMP